MGDRDQQAGYAFADRSWLGDGRFKVPGAGRLHLPGWNKQGLQHREQQIRNEALGQLLRQLGLRFHGPVLCPGSLLHRVDDKRVVKREVRQHPDPTIEAGALSVESGDYFTARVPRSSLTRSGPEAGSWNKNCTVATSVSLIFTAARPAKCSMLMPLGSAGTVS